MDGDFFCYIDHVEIGDLLRVDGWAFHQKKGQCQIEIMFDEEGRNCTKSYVLTGMRRKDVADFTNNCLSYKSGFLAVVQITHNIDSIFIKLTCEKDSCVFKILARDGLSMRSWRAVSEHVSAMLDISFLTEQGFRFASLTPRPFLRAASGLAYFHERSVPPLSAPVSVVVPVYGGKRFLYSFFRSLFEGTDARHPLILVDDGNPDRSVSAYLAALEGSRDNVVVIRNATNQGYLKSVSLGVEMATRRNPDGHVVLLNTDVEVPVGWLERLIAPIEHNNRVASVTPFTNSGTICGFPMMPDDNEPFLDASVDEIDHIFSKLRDVSSIEIPTGVGFCLALNRQVIQDIGFFDQGAF